jgi:putative transport protein
VVLAFGAAVGAVKVKGISLGPAGALFAGLALSAVDSRLAIPELIGTMGLALFTYTIGLSSGPAFFSSLRAQVRTIVAVGAVLLIAAASAKIIGALFGFDHGLTAGLFAGSLTNTPALAAAREALKGSTEPVVAYSVTYPIGVIAVIFATAWVLRRGRRAPNADDSYTPVDLVSATVQVRAEVHTDLGELADRFAGAAVFARVERRGAGRAGRCLRGAAR